MRLVRVLSVTLFVALVALVSPAFAKKEKNTPLPADGQCNFVNYHHEEAKNAKCASDCDCDGMRSCTAGTCSGKARPEKLDAVTCNSPDYHYQEAWTPSGAGKCASDCECDGQRTCVSGSCKGNPR